jgi:hypothetical protein
MFCCASIKEHILLARTLLCGLAVVSFASLTAAQGPTGAGAQGLSANVCSKHPELFMLRRLHADDAMRLIRPTGEHLTIIGFEHGYLVSGACTRFIKRFGNRIILTNNAAFGIQDLRLIPAHPANPSDGPPPSYFVPPKNIITIASNQFAEGTGRNYIKSFGSRERMTLWSGPKGSALGIIRCSGVDENPCSLDHLILSSPYRVRDFGFVPAPHSEIHAGSLWLQFALPRGEEASANYSISWWQDL